MSDPRCYRVFSMKTQLQLDYPSILANTAAPVHLALTFDAPEVTGARPQPVAFVAVIDRSGSMNGAPIEAAKRAARTVVRNLRTGDHFGLVVFDDEASTLLPLAEKRDSVNTQRVIDGIQSGDSTNLSGGWSLGRDLLIAAPAGCPRKILLLTDGQLNVGITEPALVRQLVAGGLEKDGIRTSCLGFGNGYSEDLLGTLAKATGGALHDANNPDDLPEIFRKELDGLQSMVVQNLRIRVKSCGFAERIAMLGDYPVLAQADGWQEFAMGDLVSGERRVAVMKLDVLPIPLGADGQPTATWEGEALVELEIRCDVITRDGLVSRSEHHLVKVRPVQSPEDVKVNTEVLPWVSIQAAAAAVERALQARDKGQVEAARNILKLELAKLEPMPASDLLEDARRLLQVALNALADDVDYTRSRKSMSSMNIHYCKGSSADDTVFELNAMPSFKKPKSRAWLYCAVYCRHTRWLGDCTNSGWEGNFDTWLQ